MCAHPASSRRPQVQIRDGRRYETTYCYDCKLAYQRAKTAIRRAFWMLATARWM